MVFVLFATLEILEALRAHLKLVKRREPRTHLSGLFEMIERCRDEATHAREMLEENDRKRLDCLRDYSRNMTTYCPPEVGETRVGAAYVVLLERYLGELGALPELHAALEQLVFALRGFGLTKPAMYLVCAHQARLDACRYGVEAPRVSAAVHLLLAYDRLVSGGKLQLGAQLAPILCDVFERGGDFSS